PTRARMTDRDDPRSSSNRPNGRAAPETTSEPDERSRRSAAAEGLSAIEDALLPTRNRDTTRAREDTTRAREDATRAREDATRAPENVTPLPRAAQRTQPRPKQEPPPPQPRAKQEPLPPQPRPKQELPSQPRAKQELPPQSRPKQELPPPPLPRQA